MPEASFKRLLFLKGLVDIKLASFRKGMDV